MGQLHPEFHGETPLRLFEFAPGCWVGEGNFGTTKIWANSCRCRQKSENSRVRHTHRPGLGSSPHAALRSDFPGLTDPFENNSIISRLKAGISSGLRLVTTPLLRMTSSSTQVPPAF